MSSRGQYNENSNRLMEAVKAYYADDRQPMYELLHPDVVFLSVGRANLVQGRYALHTVMEKKSEVEMAKGITYNIMSMEVKTHQLTRNSICYSLLQMDIQTCYPDGSFTQVNQRITVIWHHYSNLEFAPGDIRSGWFADHVHISIGIETKQNAPIVRHAAEVLAHAQRNIPDERNMQLEMTDVDGHTRFFRVMQIVRVEATHAMSCIYLSDGEHFIVNKSMSDMEQLLTPQGFIRLHKSHLVNGLMVRMVKNYQATLTDNTTLPVSQKKYGEVKKQLAEIHIL